MDNSNDPGDTGKDPGESREELNARFQSMFSVIKKEKTEIERENEELKAELEAIRKGTEEKRSLVTDYLDRSERMYRYAAERKLDPAVALDITGLSGMSDEERIERLLKFRDETQLKSADEFARKHGRKSIGVASQVGRVTYNELLEMSDAEIKRLPAETVSRAVEKAAAEKKTTLLDRIRGVKK